MCSSPAVGGPRGCQSAQVNTTPRADGQRARLPPSIYPFLGAVPAALQHVLQTGAPGPLQMLVPEMRSRMPGAFRDGEPSTETLTAVPKRRGTLAHRHPPALQRAEPGAVWRVSERGCLSEMPPGRRSTQGAPVWLQRWVGRMHRQGGGERGTVGTATRRKARAHPPREEAVAGAGLTLGVSDSCPAAPGIAFRPRLRRSPYGEGKRSMEEFKDFCSGGHVDARNVPGLNVRCPELRDFGPFAKQEQPPAEPHGSGVQGVGVPWCGSSRSAPVTQGAASEQGRCVWCL